MTKDKVLAKFGFIGGHSIMSNTKQTEENLHKAMDYWAELVILNKYGVIGSVPLNEEIDKIIEEDVVNSEEYQKLTDREKQIAIASVKAGAKWFRESLFDGSYR